MKSAIDIFKDCIAAVRQSSIGLEPSELNAMALDLAKAELDRLKFEASLQFQKEMNPRAVTA